MFTIGASVLPARAAERTARVVEPVLDRAASVRYDLGGPIGRHVRAVQDNWLVVAPAANPAMLEMFADRDKEPYRNLLPWSGEFAGKYLTGSVQVIRLTGDRAFRDQLHEFVGRFVALQDEDGYLGPFPREFRLTGKAPNAGDTWDAWGHYHAMLGLLLWHEDTGDERGLAAARRIGDLLCDKFLGPERSVVATGSAEMNQAVAHSLCLLYRRTGERKYLDLAVEIVDGEFPMPGAGDYLRAALAGREFFQTPKPRWESLHPMMAMAELYWLTGREDYRKAYDHLWWSIAKLDRHNNGGFSSGEQAQGNPYHRGAIETCCTIAWMALGVEMLKLTGDSVVADELELSTLNQVVGLHDPHGKWCTYNTPMDGVRKPSTVDIAFQIRPGSEELNCCSVNAARGFGMISDWGLMSRADGLVLNWYGPGKIASQVGEVPVVLTQTTEYPRRGRVELAVEPARPAEFTLRLRVPHWSAKTKVTVNGADAPGAVAATYLALRREWKSGDRVTIDFDMTPHVWAGEQESAGHASIYRGPLLLAYEADAKVAARQTNFLHSSWADMGEIHASREKGAALERRFTGDGIKWFGLRFDDAGTARVSIDGKELAVVDQYGPTRGEPFAWEHAGLGAGEHVLRLEITGDRHADSKNTWVNVAGFGPAGATRPDPDLPLPTLDVAKLEFQPVKVEPGPDGVAPLVLVETKDADGQPVRLVDFGSAGANLKPYATWLPAKNAKPTPFSRTTPLRSGRP
jgi:DUF1680 family protein